MKKAKMYSLLFFLLFTLSSIKGQLSIDRIGDDEFHTNYVDFDTDGDRTPTCTAGDPVRVQRSIDYSTCSNKASNPCKDCEMYRVRYEKAVRPCIEENPNFKERFEEEEAIWTENCPCYPNCNGAILNSINQAALFVVGFLLVWNNL